jgi:hypothetical protein
MCYPGLLCNDERERDSELSCIRYSGKRLTSPKTGGEFLRPKQTSKIAKMPALFWHGKWAFLRLLPSSGHSSSAPRRNWQSALSAHLANSAPRRRQTEPTFGGARLPRVSAHRWAAFVVTGPAKMIRELRRLGYRIEPTVQLTNPA